VTDADWFSCHHATAIAHPVSLEATLHVKEGASLLGPTLGSLIHMP